MLSRLFFVSLKPIQCRSQVCEILIDGPRELGNIQFARCRKALFEPVVIEREGGVGLLTGAEFCGELRSHLIQECCFSSQIVFPA